MSMAGRFLEKLRKERLASEERSRQIIDDCDRRINEIEETMTIKEYKALHRAREYEYEKLNNNMKIKLETLTFK
tara:strand:- start:284 stop:505 length:222 start_codon:yes stop_codon:yes gene_type:complete